MDEARSNSSVRLFAILFAFSVCTGCITVQVPGGNSISPTPQAAPTKTPEPSTPADVNGKTISAEMTDKEILAAFDIDIKNAKSTVARGPDGSSTSYQVGGQTVSITRSVVTGVYVYAYGEPIKGEWKLGGGL